MTDHDEMALILAEMKAEVDVLPDVVAERVEAAITIHEDNRHHDPMPIPPGMTAQGLVNKFMVAIEEIPSIKENQTRIFEAIEGTPVYGLNGTVIGHEGGMRPHLGGKFWIQVFGVTAAAFTMVTALFTLVAAL